MNTPDDASSRDDSIRGVRLNNRHDVVNGRAEVPSGEFGFRPFPKRGGIVTNELIDRLRNEAGV